MSLILEDSELGGKEGERKRKRETHTHTKRDIWRDRQIHRKTVRCTETETLRDTRQRQRTM